MDLNQPLPDEVAWSYLWRLRRIVGPHLLGVARQQHHAAFPTYPRELRFVASVTGVDVHTFIRRHTTIPFSHAVAARFDGDNYADALSVFLDVGGLKPIRPKAFQCPSCLAEDMDWYHGTTYWRRSHQLPGIYQCPKHGVPLRAAPVFSKKVGPKDPLWLSLELWMGDYAPVPCDRSEFSSLYDVVALSTLDQPEPTQPADFLERLATIGTLDGHLYSELTYRVRGDRIAQRAEAAAGARWLQLFKEDLGYGLDFLEIVNDSMSRCRTRQSMQQIGAQRVLIASLLCPDALSAQNIFSNMKTYSAHLRSTALSGS